MYVMTAAEMTPALFQYLSDFLFYDTCKEIRLDLGNKYIIFFTGYLSLKQENF